MPGTKSGTVSGLNRMIEGYHCVPSGSLWPFAGSPMVQSDGSPGNYFKVIAITTVRYFGNK